MPNFEKQTDANLIILTELEFYLNWYDKEAERRTALDNSLSIPIGILTVTFGADFYILAQYNFHCSALLTNIILVALIGVSFISSCITAFFLFDSYHHFFQGYCYKAFPFATELHKHKLDIVDYYQKYSASFPNITGEEKFEEYLITKLTEYLDKNAYNNDKKSKAIHLAKGYILVAILSLVLAVVPFIILINSMEI